MSFTEAWLQGPQQTQFYTRLYTPQEKPVAALVFIHGFAEHIDRHTSFHIKLAERGLVVFTFDQRGFGKTAMDKENKSPSSSYGKTSWDDQLTDIVWAIEHVNKKYPSLSVFLTGHSMGGGEVLGFATQNADSPHLEKLPLLSGIIAMSPLIHLTKPAPKATRIIGGLLSKIVPNLLFPTQLDTKGLSRDPKVEEEYIKDPMVRAQGTLRGLDDMLTQGELLLSTKYTDWIQYMPALFLQGTVDPVTSFQATKAFYDKLNAKYKKLVPFEGALHELQNEIDGIPDKVADEIVSFIRLYHQPIPPRRAEGN